MAHAFAIYGEAFFVWPYVLINIDRQTFRCCSEGVYDVTDFVKIHPGGNKILLAAG